MLSNSTRNNIKDVITAAACSLVWALAFILGIAVAVGFGMLAVSWMLVFVRQLSP